MKSFSFLYGFGKTPLKLLNLCYLQFNYKWQLIFCHGFVREANLEFSSLICLDIQIQIRIHRVDDVAGYVTEVDTFGYFFFLIALFWACSIMVGRAIDVLLFHYGLNHFRDRQLACVVRQHDVEHSFQDAFGDADFFWTLNNVRAQKMKNIVTCSL